MSDSGGFGTRCWILAVGFFVCLVLAPAQTDLVNIAYNKTANQTGAYGGAKAYRAVDGRYDKDEAGDYYLSVCAYPDTTWFGNRAARWWLDLEDVYLIHNVTVYNTFNRQAYKRMNNFGVELISEYGTRTGSCGVYDGADPVGRGGKYTFSCDEREGRYVVIGKSEGREDRQHLILCEVEVYGEPPPPGNTSSTPAAAAGNVTTSSPPVTSAPDSPDTSSTQTTTANGTSPETSTPPATSDCPAGWYGDNCERRCGSCAPFHPPVYNPCHRTGKCINGCLMWWTGDKCQQEIEPPAYANQRVITRYIGSDRVELAVEQVDVKPSLSAFYGYELVYGGKSREVPHDGNRTTIIVALTDLSYNTEYGVTVKPYRVMERRYEYGTSYPEKWVKTECTDPGVPEISAITVDDTIKVKYQGPNTTGCDNLTRIDLMYRLIDQDQWRRVSSNKGQQEAEVKVTESEAYVFKVVATNNKDLQSSAVSPTITAIRRQEGWIFSRVTVIPWSLCVGSLVLNVCLVTFLFNAYCGKSRRRRRRRNKPTKSDHQLASAGGQYPTDDPRSGVVNQQFGMTEDPQVNVEVEYATHISDVTEDSTIRPEKDKKAKKESNPGQSYNDWTTQYNTGSSTYMASEVEDYEYTRYIGDKKGKKAQKVKRVKKAKKERKRIAPHYKDSDMQENEYAVVF